MFAIDSDLGLSFITTLYYRVQLIVIVLQIQESGRLPLWNTTYQSDIVALGGGADVEAVVQQGELWLWQLVSWVRCGGFYYYIETNFRARITSFHVLSSVLAFLLYVLPVIISCCSHAKC